MLLEISQNSQKTPVPESLFYKAADWDLQLYLKRDSGTEVFLWILRNSFEHFSYITSSVAASVLTIFIKSSVLSVWQGSECTSL